MTNKYRAVMELISQCPLVGRDLYFNFIDEGCRDGNTTLTTVPTDRWQGGMLTEQG